jgi:hypothetical protein
MDRWRAGWAFAQITGVLFSTAVWVVFMAVAPEVVVAVLLGGFVLVAGFRTRAVLWLVFGARPAVGHDRDDLLRAILPVRSLRGRGQPEVFVGRGFRARGWEVVAPCGGSLLVSEFMLARIREGRVSDLEVSVRVARVLGQLPAVGSRLTLAVAVYCLPWAIVEDVARRVAHRLARVPLMSLSWRMRPLVFGLGLVDAVQHARWEAAIPLLVLAVLTYTTGPLGRAWHGKLAELGDRYVADEGLAAAPPAMPSRSDRPEGRGFVVDLEVSHE